MKIVISDSTANADFIPVVSTLIFPAGSSMGPPSSQKCTNVTIINDNLLEDEFQTVVLTASSNDPHTSFSSGGNTATISIQDDESGLHLKLL